MSGVVGDVLIVGPRAMRMKVDGDNCAVFFYITTPSTGAPYVLEKIHASCPAGRLTLVTSADGSTAVELFVGAREDAVWRGGDQEPDFDAVVRSHVPAATRTDAAHLAWAYNGPHKPILIL